MGDQIFGNLWTEGGGGAVIPSHYLVYSASFHEEEVKGLFFFQEKRKNIQKMIYTEFIPFESSYIFVI